MNDSLRPFAPALLQASSEAVAVVDRSGHISTCDDRFLRVLGIPRERASALDLGALLPDLDPAAAEGSGGTDFEPMRLTRPDGVRLWVLLRLVPIEGEGQGFRLLLIQEPSTVRRIVDRLDYVEAHDPSTGLLSRSRGIQELKNRIAGGASGTCLLCAVHGEPNEALDRSLVENVMERIIALCREVRGFDPVVARLDFDELLLLPAREGVIDAGALAALRERIRRLGDPELGFQVLVGVSLWNDRSASAIGVLDAARIDQMAFLAPASPAAALGGEGFSKDLQRALEAGEMELHIEPQVRAEDGRVSGGELLVRWRHPSRGLVPPGQFVQHLEEGPFAAPFAAWSIRQAAALLVDLRDRLGTWCPLSLNLASTQLTPQLVALLQEHTTRLAIPPGVLELELTERIISSEESSAQRAIADLHAFGFHLAVDDFGTGYSSLSYLRRFPLDRLKVDRAFVVNLVESEEDRLITNAIVSLSHVLGLEVVAEGVETAEQATILREVGADTLQGYLIGRAVPLEAFVEMALARGRSTSVLPIPDSLPPAPARTFEPVVWKRSFSTDVVSVDDEHRHLIDLLNEVSQQLHQKPQELDIEPALNRIGDETIRHFRHEERVMANIGYDRIDLHSSKHAALVADYVARRQELVNSCRQGAFEELLAYLSFWLLRHMVSEDTRLNRFLNRCSGADLSGRSLFDSAPDPRRPARSPG